MAEYQLRSLQFRKEREAGWQELSALVLRAERGGLGALRGAELLRLPELYRSALSSLGVARSISLDLALVEFLEALCGRAYLVMYRPRRNFIRATLELFRREYPRAVRQMKWSFLVATIILFAGIAVGFTRTQEDMNRYYEFIPVDLAGNRTPDSTTEELRETLYSDGEYLSFFSAFLFSHNARIGLLCFALGGLAGIPVFLLMFQNGATLGAFVALFHSRGLTIEVLAWIMPHGVTEFLAILLCGAAGLHLGHAMVFPGIERRVDALRRAGRRAGTVALGTLALFVLAGLIEGYFRQLVQSIEIRYLVVAATTAFWVFYFVFVGRKASPRHA